MCQRMLWLGVLCLSVLLAGGVRTWGAQARAESARADIGFIGLHGGVYEILEPHAKTMGLRLSYFQDSDISARSADLGSVSVLYIQHTREEDREAYRELILKAKAVNPRLVVIAFQPSSATFLKGLVGEGVLAADTEAVKYYGNTTENLRRLLIYTAGKYLGRDVKIEPPQEGQQEGLYHPDHGELFADAKGFLEWKGRKYPGGRLPNAPRVLVAVHATHLAFQQPKVVDALVRECEAQGAIAAAIIDGRSKTYLEQAKAFAPDVMIHTCHSADTVPFRLDLDVAHLHSVFFRKQSISDFETSAVGLSSSETAFHIIGQELLGAIEPQATSGTRTGGGGSEAFEPIPERVTHLVKRALAYAALRRKAESEKRVAVIYYDREMGKGELMRGSSTGMHLNAPRSLVAVLEKMKAGGVNVDPVPNSDEQLIDWMMARGKAVGVWAPGELDRLVRTGNPVLIPAAEYEKWLKARVPEWRIRQLEEKWGPAPGRFMVWEKSPGDKYIVVPRIELGNVILLPQPLRGEAHGKEALNAQAHDKLTAPPHNYLATYFWLEEGFKADALVHFGTHGSEFALPGKPSGLARGDWPDVIMGGMPNFNPWIIENMVESSPVRRRVYGTLISHLPPPIVTSGLSDELASLHETIDKWEMMEEGGLRDRFAAEIGRQVKASKLDNDLKLTLPDNLQLDPPSIQKVNDYLHSIMEESTPVSLHVLGEPPRKDLLPAYMVNVVRGPFLRDLEVLVHGHAHDSAVVGHEHDVRPVAEEIMRRLLLDGASPTDAVSLAIGRPISQLPDNIDKGLKLVQNMNAGFVRTTDEIDNLIRGLDGRFVPPGPGNSPIRNPSAVPTGRNMYLLNPDEVPMRPSWELGKKLADDIIANHQRQHGTFPTKVGFDLRSSATFRDYGVMEAQILWLLGVEPVWDERNLVDEVRLVPRDKLGRPRVDVFIAAGGWYESNLPGRLNLWDKALRLVAKEREADNPVYANTLELRTLLERQGLDPSRAEVLAPARIFGRAPGNETTNALSYFVERSGDWSDREEVARQYLANHKYVYTEGAWGEKADAAYDAAIQGTHTVVRSWSDYMTGPLASRYTWLHGGAFALGVEVATGKRPDYVFSDVRDPDKAGMVKAEDALQKEYRVRLFNRKWLEGMMKEGYSGADHMRFLVSNSFGWDTMRPGSVGSVNWGEIKRVLVDDKYDLKLKPWFEANNPYAYQDATATLLEAVRHGYWQADDATLAQLVNEYAHSVATHGLSGGLRSGGNAKLDELVRRHVAASTDPAAKELLANYERKIADQTRLTPQGGEMTAAPAAQPVPTAPPTPADSTTAEKPPQVAPPQQPTQVVTGVQAELKPDELPAANKPVPNPQLQLWAVLAGGIVLMAVVFGAYRRSGVPR